MDAASFVIPYFHVSGVGGAQGFATGERVSARARMEGTRVDGASTFARPNNNISNNRPAGMITRSSVRSLLPQLSGSL